MMDVLPDRCSVLAKRELLYFGPFGFAAWLSGLVFVDRLNREKARNTMDMIANLIHDQQVSTADHSFLKQLFCWLLPMSSERKCWRFIFQGMFPQCHLYWRHLCVIITCHIYIRHILNLYSRLGRIVDLSSFLCVQFFLSKTL